MGRRGCAGHMEAMWCHVEWAAELARAVGGLCRACEAPWVWAEPARPPVPTVLRRAPRDAPCVVDDLDCLAPSLARPTQDFRSTVVDVNEIYGLILGFTSKYKVTGPWKVRITIDQGGFQLGIYQHK